MRLRCAIVLLALVHGSTAFADDVGGAWVTPDVLRAMRGAEARQKRARERQWREALREEAVERGTVAGFALDERPEPPQRAAVLERLHEVAEEAGPPLPDGGGVPVAAARAPARVGPAASPRPADAHAAVREFRDMRSTRESAPAEGLEARAAHEFLQSMAETTAPPAIVARIATRRGTPVPPPPKPPEPRPEPAPAPYKVILPVLHAHAPIPPRPRPAAAATPAVVAAVVAPPPRPPAIPPPAFVAESVQAEQRALGTPRPKARATRGSLFDWRTRDNKSKGRRSLDGGDL